uniref:Uncharacterized protein n=1 Tax=Anopheles melas TaxID=34690 RepID=A0A182UAK6_9DIPT
MGNAVQGLRLLTGAPSESIRSDVLVMMKYSLRFAGRKPEQCRDREGDERFGQRRTGAPADLPMVGGRWRLLTAAGHLCLQIDVDHVGRLVVVHRRHIDHVRARIGDQHKRDYP